MSKVCKKCKCILCFCLGPISKIAHCVHANISQPENKISRVLKNSLVLSVSRKGGSALSTPSSKSEAAHRMPQGSDCTVRTIKTEEEFTLLQFGRVWGFGAVTVWHRNERLSNTFCFRHACKLTMVSFSPFSRFTADDPGKGKGNKDKLRTDCKPDLLCVLS